MNRRRGTPRYYGYYSCRARGERKKQAPVKDEDAIEELPELEQQPSSYWARCIKLVYEVDPLECPKCKAQMRIVAFVQDPLEITQIKNSLKLPDFRAPPPIPKAPRIIDEMQFDTMPDYEA